MIPSRVRYQPMAKKVNCLLNSVDDIEPATGLSSPFSKLDQK